MDTVAAIAELFLKNACSGVVIPNFPFITWGVTDFELACVYQKSGHVYNLMQWQEWWQLSLQFHMSNLVGCI